MNSGLAVSQEMKRNPVDRNCNGVFGVAFAISRIRSHGSSFLYRTATPMCVDVVKSMALKPTRSITGAMRQRSGRVDAQRRPEALVAVAKRGFHQLNFSHASQPPAPMIAGRREQPTKKPVSTPPAWNSVSANTAAWKARLVATPAIRVAATAPRRRARAVARSGPLAMILAISES